MPCQIPDDLLKFTSHRKNLRNTTKHHHSSRNSMHHTHLHSQPQIPGQPMQARSATDLYAPENMALNDPMNRMQIPAIGNFSLKLPIRFSFIN